MTLASLFCYTLATWGLSFTLAYAKITLPFRNALDRCASAEQTHLFGKWQIVPGIIRWAAKWALSLMECVVCTGFWISAGSVAFVLYSGHLASTIVQIHPAIVVFAAGFYTLGAHTVLGLVTGLIREDS